MGIINLLNNLLLANWPNGFWQNLIAIFYDFINDYGLTIIIFTIVLKIVLIPLDFMQRKTTKNNAEKQAKLKPQMDKLQKKYGNNKEMLNQKTMELYKKENYNIMGSCFGMLLNLGLTLVIFITLFSALNNISQFKIAEQYIQLEGVYTTTYEQEILTNDEETATNLAQQAVSQEYAQIKEGFLWIENIWRPDRNTNIIPTYSEYMGLTNISVEEGGPTEEQYNEVMGALSQEYSDWNGYFILIILAAVITFFSQKIIQKFTNPAKTNTKQNQDIPQPNTKVMSYILPVLMVLFTWGYSSAFALYIITNSAMTMVTSVLAYKILEKQEAKKEQESKAEYSR